jgi:hypothetical protein
MDEAKAEFGRRPAGTTTPIDTLTAEASMDAEKVLKFMASINANVSVTSVKGSIGDVPPSLPPVIKSAATPTMVENG